MRRRAPGVARSKLKWPNPAPWICATGSPSPVIRYQSRAPFTSAVPSTASGATLLTGVSMSRCLTSRLSRLDGDLDVLGHRRRRTRGGSSRRRGRLAFGSRRRTSRNLAGLSAKGYGSSVTRHGPAGSSAERRPRAPGSRAEPAPACRARRPPRPAGRSRARAGRTPEGAGSSSTAPPRARRAASTRRAWSSSCSATNASTWSRTSSAKVSFSEGCVP